MFSPHSLTSLILAWFAAMDAGDMRTVVQLSHEIGRESGMRKVSLIPSVLD